MKKISLVLTCFTLILCQNTVYSAVTEKITETRGYISASVEKTKEVAPNVASVTFTKENTAKTLDAASNDNKAAISKMNAALEKLKTSGIKLEAVKGSYNVSPNYSYKTERKLIDYTVTNSITVKTSDTESLGTIIDAVLAAGADRVSSLYFSYESTGNNCNELIWQATHETREMAKVAANAAGQEIKGLKAISTSCQQGINNSTTLMRNFAGSGQSAKMADIENIIETSITPQKIKIRANVHAEYYVK